MAVTVQQLNQLYLAYFGRPADFNGVQFYTANPNATVASVAAAFSASPESQAMYGSTFGAAQINAIYRVLFNRDAEPAGLAYWSQEVAAGRLSPAMAAYGILIGAQNADAAAVANKLQISTAFYNALDTSAEIIGYGGSNAAATARAYLATVTSDAATVTAAQAALNAQVAAATTGNGNGGVITQTFSLTPGNDTAGTTSAFQSGLASQFRFSSGNERVEAGIGTLQATDVFLDSTTTDADELVVQLNGASGTFTAQNIENIKATFVSGNPALNLNNVIGTKLVEVNGSVAGQVNGFAATATSPTIRSAGYTNTLTVTPTTLEGTAAAGTAETLNVEVTGASFGTTAATRSVVVIDGVGGAGTLETLNLTSSGSAANTFQLSTANGAVLGTVNVKGSADATVRVVHADVTGITVNATENTGFVNFSIDRNGAGTASTNLTNFTGVDKFTFRDSVNGTDALVATNVAAGAAVEVQANFAAGSSLSVKGSATNTADVLSLTVDHATANTATTLAGLDIQNVETLNLASNGNSAATLATGSNAITLTGDFTAINITGDTAVTLAVNVDDPATGNLVTTINASGLTGTAAASISAAADTAATNRYVITGTANADAIAGGAGNDTLTLGDGNDGATATAGADRVTLGAGRDTVTFSTAFAGAAAGDVTTIADFVTGTTDASRDVVAIDVSEAFGGQADIVANLSAANYAEGTAAAVAAADNTIIVITDTAYANFADAETAVEARKAATLDYAVVFLNSSTGFAELWIDADSSVAGSGVRLAVFENITTLTGVVGFDAANFATV